MTRDITQSTPYYYLKGSLQPTKAYVIAVWII